MHENDLSYRIRGAAFTVHTELGPGLFESVYEVALAHELQKDGLDVKRQLGIPVHYDGLRMDQGYRADLLVVGKVIVEIKSVETLQDVHYKQLLTYIRLADIRLGLLMNFNSVSLKDSITRIVNDL
ncbi:GxxExxY protein [Rhodohalobacter sp. SW132]|uniref:GxxExxY protein n=1 Tax=Rhodohalobacter sp. SW132 TaxID=2293433 RepID=UPI000E251DF9|nr:GxxExxY protein [Rhodohalobacter sp. SW132]REL38839.1 GxxExxY protein [Rhodohalobacter sp. SW132]